MKLSSDEVRKIAKLARLGISEEETESYALALTRVLGYIEKISEVDVTDVPPSGYPGQQQARMREDELRTCLDRETVLRQAPDPAEGLFRVRAVLPTQDTDDADSPEEG